MLFQRHSDNIENPIAFYSQKLNKAQKNYSVTEKECLAAVMAIKRFRPYVELMKFTVITDHASLMWLMNLKDLSGRLAIWSLQLQGYNFDIEHRKGKENVVADMLSRLPIVEEIDIENLLGIETTEFDSEEYLELINTIENNKDKMPDLRVENNMIFKRVAFTRDEELNESEWRLWIPEALAHILIEKAHDDPTSGHGESQILGAA